MSIPQDPPPYDPYGSGGAYQGQPRPGGKGLAITALVLGILAILTFILCGLGVLLGVIGIILGIIGAVKKRGTGIAVTGIILSLIGVVAGVVIWGWFFSVAAKCAIGPDGQPLPQSQQQQCISEEFGIPMPVQPPNA